MKPRHTWFKESLPPVEVTWDLERALADLDPSRLVILAGAGISADAPSWLPTAERFLSSLYVASLPRTLDWSEVFRGPLKPRFELVVDILRDQVDPELEVLEVFRGGRPNTCHRAIAKLVAQGALTVTTNFDSLLERAIEEHAPYCAVYAPEDFGEPRPEDRFCVWHLHGVLEDPETGEPRPESIVASIRDCWISKSWFRLDQRKGAFLKELLEARDLLVVGYSGADDYDIAPCLEEIGSEQKVIWVDHAIFDLTAGPPPSVVMKAYEGDVWYRDPSLNSLAAAIYAGNRSPDRVRVLKYKTGHVLQELSGLVDPNDPVEAGPGDPRELPSFLHSTNEQLRQWALSTARSAMAGLRLEEHFSSWSERFVPNEQSRYRLALRLSKALGFKGLTEHLRGELYRRFGEPQSRGGGVSSDAGGALFILGLATGNKLLAARALADVGPEHLSIIEQEVLGMAEVQLELAAERFMHEFGTGEFKQARPYALEARELALEARLPRVAAGAARLLARMAEREGREERDVEDCYVDAVEAAEASGEVNLIAQAQGELGIYLLDRLDPELETLDPSDVGRLERFLERARMAVGPLSKAYRIHVAQGDTEALSVVAAKLGTCLSFFSDQILRSLRAHGIACRCLDELGATAGRDTALDMIRSLTLRLEAAPLRGDQIASTPGVEALLSWLDEHEDSKI